ncbi:uncharacterized protein PHA67_009767 [Liasis olivaceus]
MAGGRQGWSDDQLLQRKSWAGTRRLGSRGETDHGQRRSPGKTIKSPLPRQEREPPPPGPSQAARAPTEPEVQGTGGALGNRKEKKKQNKPRERNFIETRRGSRRKVVLRMRSLKGTC